MENLLLLAHVENSTLGKPVLEALTAARQLLESLPGSTLTLGLVGGPDVHQAATTVGGCGANRVLGVVGPEFQLPRYHTDAAAAEALVHVANPTLILAPGTSRWSRCLAGVAQRVGGRIDTHVTSFAVSDGGLQVSRWYYRQRLEAVLSRTHRPWFVLMDPGCFPAWGPQPAPVALEEVPVQAHSRTQFLEFRSAQGGEQTIRPDAKLLFVAGAGWTKKQADGKVHLEEAAELILTFLRKTQASLGSTKSLVDLAAEGQAVLPFLTHLNQVGQTGSTPRHPKGLATCCHGEEPHVIGWRFINQRRAINLDPNCGWAHGKADVLYVADAFEVLRKLNDLL